MPKQRLGKRSQVNLSSHTTRAQTQGNNKKKKMTDDDQAAMEAQEMVELGTKQEWKPTQRK